jgi:hypothetical protein
LPTRVPHRQPDYLQHPFRIRQYIIIPKPDDMISSRLNPFGPRCILLDLGAMLSAIQLDNQLCSTHKKSAT